MVPPYKMQEFIFTWIREGSLALWALVVFSKDVKSTYHAVSRMHHTFSRYLSDLSTANRTDLLMMFNRQHWCYSSSSHFNKIENQNLMKCFLVSPPSHIFISFQIFLLFFFFPRKYSALPWQKEVMTNIFKIHFLT